jgi:hypothetical protein
MARAPKSEGTNHPTSTHELDTPDIVSLMAEIKLLNANLERDIHSRSNWKLAMRNGVLGAVGGLVGSSIVFAVLVHFAKPLGQIVELRPALERLAGQQPGHTR